MGDAPVDRPRRNFATLSGLDRSGPPAPQTQRGAPLNPWTIPNAIGYVRAALLPVFLVLALDSKTGTDPLPATIFAIVAWSDYADGFAARLTGQFSRLGALMDPIIDRLLVICGVVVCWHFRLLDRWALDLLVAREVSMLIAGRVALSQGRELRVNYVGRWAVLPVMGSLFMGLVGLREAGNVALVLGVAMALTATALYVREFARPSTSG